MMSIDKCDSEWCLHSYSLLTYTHIYVHECTQTHPQACVHQRTLCYGVLLSYSRYYPPRLELGQLLVWQGDCERVDINGCLHIQLYSSDRKTDLLPACKTDSIITCSTIITSDICFHRHTYTTHRCMHNLWDKCCIYRICICYLINYSNSFCMEEQWHFLNRLRTSCCFMCLFCISSKSKLCLTGRHAVWVTPLWTSLRAVFPSPLCHQGFWRTSQS